MERSEFWLAFKATFGSVWSWLGIFLGAMSLINLGVAYFELGIGPVVEQMIAAYRQIIHPIFDWFFFWIDWKPPEWLADSIVLYLIIGAAMRRAGAMVPLYLEERGRTNDLKIMRGHYFVGTKGGRMFFVLSNTLIWPIAIRQLWDEEDMGRIQLYAFGLNMAAIVTAAVLLVAGEAF